MSAGEPAPLPRIFHATLPVPPSINATYRTTRGNRWYRTTRAETWSQSAVLRLRVAGWRVLPAADYWIALEVAVFTLRVDIDNLLKSTLDAIAVALGVDDRAVGVLTVRRVLVDVVDDQRLELAARVVPVKGRDGFNRESRRLRLPGR